MFRYFFDDMTEVLRLRSFWFKLSWLEFYGWYGRLNLGLAWVVISPLVFALGISVVYADVFGSNFYDHFVYVYSGYICWLYISDTLGTGAEIYSSSYSYYSEVKLPILGFNIKGTFVRTYAFLINIVVYYVVCSFFGLLLNPLIIMAAVLYFVLFFTFLSVILSIATAYLPDLKLVIQNMMRVLFFITPIVWVPSEDISGVKAMLLFYNPFYYFVSIFRDASLETINSHHWAIALIMFVCTFCLAIFLYSRFSRRMVFVCK